MPYYEVGIVRIANAYVSFVVHADDPQQAVDQAFVMAANTVFSEDNADYEVDDTRDITCEGCEGTGIVQGIGEFADEVCAECEGRGYNHE